MEPLDLQKGAGCDTNNKSRAEQRPSRRHMEANNLSAALEGGQRPWLLPKLQLTPHSTPQIDTLN